MRTGKILDVYHSVDKYADPEKQLHRHAFYHTQPGDIIVVDARGDMHSGVFGEMSATQSKHAFPHRKGSGARRVGGLQPCMKLAAGGHLRKYYPLSDEARAEYEERRVEELVQRHADTRAKVGRDGAVANRVGRRAP